MARKRSADFIPVATGEYRKLSPNELEARGISRKAERYVNPDGELISKRRYQESQLYERTGRRVTLAERALAYLKGWWTYVTKGARRAATGRRAQVARTTVQFPRRLTIEQMPKKDRLKLEQLSKRRARGGRKITPEEWEWFDDLAEEYDTHELYEALYPEAIKK